MQAVVALQGGEVAIAPKPPLIAEGALGFGPACLKDGEAAIVAAEAPATAALVVFFVVFIIAPVVLVAGRAVTRERRRLSMVTKTINGPPK